MNQSDRAPGIPVFFPTVLATALILSLGSCALFQKPVTDREPPAGVPSDEPREEAPPEEPPVLSIDETYEAISLSVQAGDPDAAIAAYREAELEDPENPRTRVLLANLYLIAGELGDAERLVFEVLEEEPENTEAIFIGSLIASARGDNDRQRELLERILTVDPADSRALAALGELQLQERELDAAARSFTAAISDEGDNLVARMGLANVLLRQEEYEAAEQELDTVIAESPNYAFSYSDRARARSMQRNLSGAAEDLSSAIELNPDYQWHYIDRGRVLMAQGRYEQAVSDFTMALELDDSRFITHILRGRARDALGLREAALTDFENGLRLRPDYYPAYTPAATLYYEAGRPAEAATFYRGAFEAEPERLEFILMTALAYKAAGDDESAEEFINEKLSLVPRDSIIYTVARYYLLPRNDGFVLQQLREEANATLGGQMYFYVGAQLELMGRPETARAAFREAENNVPVGFLERRLASWHLDSYRSGYGSNGESPDDQASRESE